jgi:hypothetical protein
MSVTAYCKRLHPAALFPFLNYRMPDHVLTGATDRLLRVLGRHEKGPFG